MQRLHDVDVAEAGDDALIEQRHLDRRRAAAAGARQHRRRERRGQRLRPERADDRVLGEPGGRHQVHRPEAPRIVEGHDGAGRQAQDDVVVAIERLRRAAVLDAEVAGHAEVHEQRLARGEIGEQVLGPAVQLEDRRARQPGREVGRKRTAQVGAAQDDLVDALADEDGREEPANGFDFGQLGHVPPV